MGAVEPRQLTDASSREVARHIRNRHWAFMEKVRKHGTVWYSPWNKRRLPEAEDEYRAGLIDGLELMEWFARRHPDWLTEGPWDDERDARPMTLTDAGRAALENKHLYDMEPVYGGLVEPGWQAIPAAPQGPEP